MLLFNHMKAIRLVFVIASVMYFFAMFFKIILEGEEDFEGHRVLTVCGQADGYFSACFNGWQMKFWEEMIKLNYFSFTTLSTVGFGDFDPKSNIERLYMSFGMLLGVAIFSSILGNFIEMFDKMKEVDKEYEDGINLLRFFDLFRTFNYGEPMPTEIKH